MGYMCPFLRLLPLLLPFLFLVSCASKAQYPVRTYPLGESVRLGSLSYTVYDTQWLPQLGEGPTARIPRERFFLVRLSVTNNSSRQIIVPTLILNEDSGGAHSELSNGDRVPQWTGFLRRLPPNGTLQGNIVFDVRPQHYQLAIADEMEDKRALIDIPLTFGADSPSLPLPGKQ